MKFENLCIKCMNEKESPDQLCPYCGFDPFSYRPAPHHLPTYTVLHRRYLLGIVLGEGGFGITYIGMDMGLQIPVAIKEYYPNGTAFREKIGSYLVYTGDADWEEFQKGRERFLEEARTLAKFQGLPGIVEVKDFFEENDTAYIVMEYLPGITLKKYLKKRGRLSVEETLSMMLPLIDALKEVHKKGVIHRDISPDNIMLMKDGRRKLLDFGGAREMSPDGGRSLSILLKPGYAPEEQYRSRGKQGPWTDVYALCATIYRCITGEVPIEALERCQEDHLEKPHNLGVKISKGKEAALMHGMEVYAKDRFQSMEALEEALYRTDLYLESGEQTRQKKRKQMEQEFYPDLKKGRIRYVASGIILIFSLLCFLVAGLLFIRDTILEEEGIYQNDTENTEIENGQTERRPVVTDPQYLIETPVEAQEIETEEIQDLVSTYQVIVGDHTWEEAREYCEQHGGHLATITTEEEQEEIESILYLYIRQNESNLYAVWLGAESTQEDGEFQWITGENFSSYQKWALGEPNNEDGTEHYLIMYNLSSEETKWFWNDAPNDVSEYYSGHIGFIMENG